MSQRGARLGARQKGTLNKRTEEQIAKVEATGQTPLDFLLSVMRDESRPIEVRIDAAKSAAPFVHPKLSAVANLNPGEGQFELKWKDKSDEEIWQEIDRLDAEIAPYRRQIDNRDRAKALAALLARSARDGATDIEPVEQAAPFVEDPLEPEPEPTRSPAPPPLPAAPVDDARHGVIRWRLAGPSQARQDEYY